ncbi:EAL domain-containing protein [Patescibacteria group bacterium]|nr:EAL domain-containing protein [Patescibacteria group bacterium]
MLFQYKSFTSLRDLPSHQEVASCLKQLSETLQKKRGIFALLSANFSDSDLLQGFAFTEELLRSIAKRLLAITGQNGMIGYERGNFFIIYIPENDTGDPIAPFVAALDSPFTLEKGTFQIAARFGIVTFPRPRADPDVIFSYALCAFEEAKKPNGTLYHVYSDESDYQTLVHRVTESELLRALKEDEFFVRYQPIVTEEKILGFEALARWKHPKHGFISPTTFILVAEDKGFIHHIDLFVLKAACLQWHEWKKVYPSPLMISVNISSIHLQNGAFLDNIKKVLEEVTMDPHHLILEITETAPIEDYECVISALQALCAIGVRIAIDDLCTGHSTIDRLRKLNNLKIVHLVKIDRGLVDGITNEEISVPEETIIELIVNLAKAFCIEIIAEGVSTREQLAFLQKIGCNTFQGFLFSPAKEPEEITKILADQTTLFIF